ncbi:MAG TPA: cell surface protein SprA, partial [Bacteroidia bacterium]
VDLDVRSYKKLKMFIHGESFPGTDALRDGDLTVFVRLGTDYTDNYYEYEIPLYITAPGNYNNNTDDDRRRVWRLENDMDIVFADLQNAKQSRNDKLAQHITGYSLNSEYTTYITDENGYARTIRIKGNPNLSTIKTIMIGIRNPKKTVSTPGDDGRDKCAEVWVNELRLTDFDENGGWAATTRVTAKLADWGTLSVSGNMSTPGWGSIDKKVSERKKETVMQYDISSQLEMGKFIPQRYNIHIPLFMGFSEGRINPQYNPQDPDILLSNLYHNPELSQVYKDSIKHETQDYTRRRSINLTNVKKDRGKNQTKAHIWDIENFAFNASYSELYNRSFTVKHYLVKDYRGGFTYNFTAQPKNIKPFAKVKLFQPKSLALIRDFNFFPYPNKFSFLTDMDRHYSERLMRNTTGDVNLLIDTTYEKHWNWIRSYDLNYDIAKSLKLVYSADNLGQVREPLGKIDTDVKKDSVKNEVKNLGTNTHYNQKVKIDYTVPINKFPLMDWVTATAGYNSNYDWIRSSFLADSLGNTLQNNNMKTLNVQMNFTSFYNHIEYLKKLNQRIAQKNSSNGKGPNTTPPPPPKPKNPADTLKKKPKDNQYEVLDYILRTLMMVKNASITYTNNGGMVLPGFTDKPVFLGMNPGTAFTGTGFSPGAGFVFGDQRDPRDQFVKDGLMTKAMTNTPFTKTSTKNITGRANIEPLPDFKIEVTANRNESKSFNEFFQYNNLSDQFQHLTPSENGTFSMSFLSYKTAFEKQGKDYVSPTFEKFLNNRATISTRLHEQNTFNSSTLLNTGYWDGYGATQQEVMMFSFLSAYSGGNENNYALKTFPSIPKPNWRITYDGLAKIPFIKKRFKTFTISHGYRSALSYNYTTNLEYQESNGGESGHNATGDLIVRQQINTISISEQFSPLIKVDMAMNNKITGNVEIKKERNIALSFANSQVTELNSHEYIFGTGYRIPQVPIPFMKKKKNQKNTKSSDLVLKCDLSIRRNVTVIRKVVENVTQPTAGQTTISIKLSADYVLSERLNIRLFYDQIITHPAVSTSFNTSNINSGVSIRFTLSQ